jgi:predicted SAM-dependent methyltransferase
MKLLNLGCGNRYHPNWINLDFTSNDHNVQSHNLLNGIPFADHTFDVVYHSHVLEHFSKTDGKQFIKECYRVLKHNGIIRIAVPDLEQIAKEYLRNLEKAMQGDRGAEFNYDWIMLEMYDQTVRNHSGGEMAKYLFQENIYNEEYIFGRIGQEGRLIRESYLSEKPKINISNNSEKKSISHRKNIALNIINGVKKYFKHKLYKEEVSNYNSLQNEIAIGKFRLGGEVHQWMYDRYSLSKILSENGFHNIEKQNAFKSNIPEWKSYGLESNDGIIFKPDSLFVEARK